MATWRAEVCGTAWFALVTSSAASAPTRSYAAAIGSISGLAAEPSCLARYAAATLAFWQRLQCRVTRTMPGPRLCRAAQLVWEPVDTEGGGSPHQVLALGIDLAADEAHDLLADALQIGGPVPVGDEPASLHARLSSCCEASPPQEAGSSYMSSGPVWPTCSGRRPVSPADRCTVGELLAHSDALARGTLLDRTLDRAPAM
jgi:hypothetical protein